MEKHVRSILCWMKAVMMTLKTVSYTHLVLTSSLPLNQAVTLKIEKQSFQPETAITIWSDQDDKSYQQIGTYAEPNISILTGYLKITTALSQVSAEKVWEDNHNKNQKRPEQIELKLYRGSKKHEKASLVQTITLNEKNNWKTAVSNLPAFDASGNHIFYTMEEKKVNGYEGSVQELSLIHIFILRIGW